MLPMMWCGGNGSVQVGSVWASRLAEIARANNRQRRSRETGIFCIIRDILCTTRSFGRMPRLPFFVLALLALGGMLSPAENLALVRDSAIVTAQALHGDVPVKLVPVTPAREISAIILSDTLPPGEITRVRRSLLATFPAAHMLEISSGGDTRALLSALCGAANG